MSIKDATTNSQVMFSCKQGQKLKVNITLDNGMVLVVTPVRISGSRLTPLVFDAANIEAYTHHIMESFRGILYNLGKGKITDNFVLTDKNIIDMTTPEIEVQPLEGNEIKNSIKEIWRKIEPGIIKHDDHYHSLPNDQKSHDSANKTDYSNPTSVEDIKEGSAQKQQELIDIGKVTRTNLELLVQTQEKLFPEDHQKMKDKIHEGIKAIEEQFVTLTKGFENNYTALPKECFSDPSFQKKWNEFYNDKSLDNWRLALPKRIDDYMDIMLDEALDRMIDTENRIKKLVQQIWERLKKSEFTRYSEAVDRLIQDYETAKTVFSESGNKLPKDASNEERNSSYVEIFATFFKELDKTVFGLTDILRQFNI